MKLCTLAWDVDHGTAIGLATLQRLQGEVHSLAEVLLGAGGDGERKLVDSTRIFLGEFHDSCHTCNMSLIDTLQMFCLHCTLYGIFCDFVHCIYL